MGSGDRAEQLALDQRVGERRAVDFDERMIAPPAVLVHDARDLALPRPDSPVSRMLTSSGLTTATSRRSDASAALRPITPSIRSDRRSDSVGSGVASVRSRTISASASRAR
jgi:hypothetical protein